MEIPANWLRPGLSSGASGERDLKPCRYQLSGIPHLEHRANRVTSACFLQQPWRATIMPFAAASFALGPLGRLTRRLIEGPFGLLARFTSLEHNVIDILDKRAIEQSVDYISSHMAQALAMRSREDLWIYAANNSSGPGLWLEFGVFSGYSINFLAKLTPRTIYGFDSFEGLREDWKGTGLARGSFDLGGKLPRVRKNVRLVKGWFNETLPAFLAANKKPILLLHLDCDTYEATSYILNEVADLLTAETTIIMDDHHGFRGFQEGQFKAWAEFVEARGLHYRYAAFNRHAVAIRDVHLAEPPTRKAGSIADCCVSRRKELMPAG